MKKFVNVAKKNFKVQLRDKKGLIFTLLIPIFFYGLMGTIFGGTDKSNNIKTYNIGWVDLNRYNENEFSHLNIARSILNDTEQFNISIIESNQTAVQQLKDKSIDAYVLFPEGFKEYLASNSTEYSGLIVFYFTPSSDIITQNIISSAIINVIDEVINFNPSNKNITYEIRLTEGKKVNKLTRSTPGFLLYGILSGLTGSIVLITTEHKDKILKRLQTSSMKPTDLINGYFISNTALVFIQVAIGWIVLTLFGFQPNFASGPSLIFGMLLTLLLMSFLQNALALVLSSVFKKPEIAAGGIWMILIPLLLFSGGLFPLEVLTPNLVPFVKFIPTRIVVLLFQELLLNASIGWSLELIGLYLVLMMESVLIYLLGIKLYTKFVQS